MFVLGIDQGLAHMGYAYLEVEFKKTNRKHFVQVQDNIYVKIIESGCLVTGPSDDFPKRLFILMTRLENKILDFMPEVICCEHLFFSPPAKGSRNKSSSIMTTNMVTGIIAYICGKHRISFATYPPTTVKKKLCDDGRASKEDVINKIDEIFKVEAPNDKRDHICDAIAIGLAHSFHIQKASEESTN